MMHTPVSINDIAIEIPADRWTIITEAHPEVAQYLNDIIETIEDPDIVYAGTGQRSVAVKEIERGKFLSVLYNESADTRSRLITVFLTRNLLQFDESNIIWTKST